VVFDVTSLGSLTQDLYVGAHGQPTVVTGTFSHSWNGGTNVFTFTTNGPSLVTISWEEFEGGYSFYGVFNETTGFPTGTTCNVTAHFIGNLTDSFLVNGSYTYYPASTPLFFVFELGTYDREWWVGELETSTIYIFTEEPNLMLTYTVAFLDFGGVLDDYPIVEARRLINGTYHVVDKRQVDEEQKIIFNLMNGQKYQICLRNGASHTFGDLQLTDTTSIQLILKAVDFPKDTLRVYRYVRIYAEREWGIPNGNISITYQDTLELTNSVDIYINYRNGTNAYNATEVTDSFVHTWTSASNTTDYAVVCEIDHARYGVYEWRQWLPQNIGSTPPWGLEFLGNLPFDSYVIIPSLIILIVAGVFSQINAEVGAFLAVIMGAFFTLMGWLPIPSGSLITAFCFAVLMALVYSKRRVST